MSKNWNIMIILIMLALMISSFGFSPGPQGGYGHGWPPIKISVDGKCFIVTWIPGYWFYEPASYQEFSSGTTANHQPERWWIPGEWIESPCPVVNETAPVINQSFYLMIPPPSSSASWVPDGYTAIIAVSTTDEMLGCQINGVTANKGLGDYANDYIAFLKTEAIVSPSLIKAVCTYTNGEFENSLDWPRPPTS